MMKKMLVICFLISLINVVFCLLIFGFGWIINSVVFIFGIILSVIFLWFLKMEFKLGVLIILIWFELRKLLFNYILIILISCVKDFLLFCIRLMYFCVFVLIVVLLLSCVFWLMVVLFVNCVSVVIKFFGDLVWYFIGCLLVLVLNVMWKCFGFLWCNIVLVVVFGCKLFVSNRCLSMVLIRVFLLW